MSEATDIQLAYIAGFFDGEGCVAGRSKKGYRRVGISIVQINHNILEWIKELLKIGRIYYGAGTNHNLCSYRIDDKNAIEKFINLILPYSIGKKKELIIGKELNKLSKLSNLNSQKREELYNKLKELKRDVRSNISQKNIKRN